MLHENTTLADMQLKWTGLPVCTWENLLAGVSRRRIYGGANCAGTPTLDNTYPLKAVLELRPTSLNLLINAVNNTVFTRSLAVAITNCRLLPVMTNANIMCGGPGGGPGASGGFYALQPCG